MYSLRNNDSLRNVDHTPEPMKARGANQSCRMTIRAAAEIKIPKARAGQMIRKYAEDSVQSTPGLALKDEFTR
jgi:hypothetical protein